MPPFYINPKGFCSQLLNIYSQVVSNMTSSKFHRNDAKSQLIYSYRYFSKTVTYIFMNFFLQRPKRHDALYYGTTTFWYIAQWRIISTTHAVYYCVVGVWQLWVWDKCMECFSWPFFSTHGVCDLPAWSISSLRLHDCSGGRNPLLSWSVDCTAPSTHLPTFNM